MTGLVLVTGATGKTGKALVALLKENGIAHRAASRTGERPFDWTQPETWTAALEGVSSVYLVAPPTVDDPYARIIAFARAAMEQGVRRFVFLSMASLPAGGPAHGQVHQWLIDNADDWAVLAPGAFMQNFTEGSHLATIRGENTIYSNTGGGRLAFISAEDIARAAFALLTGPSGLNRDFVITGNQPISYDDVARMIGEARGRPITHTRISTQALIERFIRRGLPELTAHFLAGSYEAIARGEHAGTTDTFETLTGRPPIAFEQFARANAGVWKPAT